MLKKLGAIISVLIIFCALAYSSVQPAFKDYGESYEVYVGEASSLADIKRISRSEYAFVRGIKGESVELSLSGFDLEKTLSEFSAEVKFIETTSDSLIYYAYSPKLKYLKKVRGENVNLHIVVAKNRVIMGSPLIFGSF